MAAEHKTIIPCVLNVAQEMLEEQDMAVAWAVAVSREYCDVEQGSPPDVSHSGVVGAAGCKLSLEVTKARSEPRKLYKKFWLRL